MGKIKLAPLWPYKRGLLLPFIEAAGDMTIIGMVWKDDPEKPHGCLVEGGLVKRYGMYLPDGSFVLVDRNEAEIAIQYLTRCEAVKFNWRKWMGNHFDKAYRLENIELAEKLRVWRTDVAGISAKAAAELLRIPIGEYVNAEHGSGFRCHGLLEAYIDLLTNV